MKIHNELDKIIEYSPEKKDDWLSLNDFFNLLQNSDTKEDVAIYISNHNDVLISSLFVKKEHQNGFRLDGSFIKEDHCWYSNYYKDSSTREDRVLYSYADSDIEPIHFLCSFGGRTDKEEKSYFDFFQKLIHVLRLSYVPHKKAYCLYDELGDVVEVIAEKKYNNFTFITFKRRYLDYYMWLNDFVLAKCFDCTRVVKGKELSYPLYEKDLTPPAFVTSVEMRGGNSGAFANGYNIMDIQTPIENLLHYDEKSTFELQKYEVFKFYDWRYERVLECSLNPENFTNYFVKTENKPFDTSTIFFKIDVLIKYKNNPDKYTIGNRRIDCAGWGLRAFDINNDVVSTYPCYLRSLPTSEQTYWKSYNIEPPENGYLGGISEQAWINDFEGKFYDSNDVYSNLDKIKKELSSFMKIPQDISIPILIEENSKSWADHIATLQNIFINSLPEKKLKTILSDKGVKYQEIQKSISILEAIFKDDGKKIDFLDVLKEINLIRNKVYGHYTTKEALDLIDKAKHKNGNLKEHYIDTLNRLLICLKELLPFFQDNFGNTCNFQ